MQVMEVPMLSIFAVGFPRPASYPGKGNCNTALPKEENPFSHALAISLLFRVIDALLFPLSANDCVPILPQAFLNHPIQ